MKSFFKTLLASTLGVIIGSVILMILSIVIFAGIIASMGSTENYSLKEKTILTLDLKGSLGERSESSPLNKIMGNPDTVGLEDILDAIKKAKENDEIKGIYIKAGALNGGLANIDPIRNALIDFKTTGKFVVAYADNYLQNTYYIASVADKVIMNPKGSFDFRGISSNLIFRKNMNDKLGINYQVFKVGTFKSAVEPYIQDKMSEANRLQRTSYLNDIWSHLLAGISESRTISVEALNSYADRCLTFMPADSILQYNFVDTLMYKPGVEAYLKTLVDIEADKKLSLASIDNMTGVKFKEAGDKKSRIAILYAEGAIVDSGDGGGLFDSGATITAEQYVRELQKLRDNEDIKAVVFRVNSPGGSAYASEQIWNAVVELKAKKPVIVSMGDYAASGGYYISCAATAIVAQPSTLTGSIGIFGLIPEGEELSKKIGFSFDEVNTNKHSSFGGPAYGIPFLFAGFSRSFNDEEKQILQKYIESGYDLFITRCADGRSKTKAEIDSIGQGRVWTGSQAIKLGLVDKIGGIEDAIKMAAEQAKVTDYSISKYPEKKTLFAQILEDSFSNSKLQTLKFFMGENNFEKNILKQHIQSFDMQMAMMPDRISY
ncbi:protease-4 [Dysgonomonas alginatilytica]|uniref:Protease-4 n=1 Tax=Dysgonomonas alginatilytica TaxID=1605892 RepID=A0A2V3PW54_9BACT|nr:signal peptide peptidase SppA [Dysgonomonas alginatilytica]PXV69071.1 protease-4 [Dysgonomonas alginatilytica]